jgi:hypothetical protein
MGKPKQSHTTLPPMPVSFEDAVTALLRTPPPPAAHPATRKRPSKKQSKKKT